MTSKEKLIQKIQARPSEMRFSEVETLLGHFGWFEDKRRSGSSHVIFKDSTGKRIPIPKSNNKVKEHYLNEICAQLGLDTE